MNSVVLIGRLTREPELKYTASQHAVCRFTIAIDRVTKQGEEKKTDFPRVIVYDRQAENCDKFLRKGRLVGVQGKLTTGSYQDKDGKTVYTTDVVADRVEFLEWGNTSQSQETHAEAKIEPQNEPNPNEFAQLPEDIPF